MTSQRTHRRRGMMLGMAAVAGLAAVAAQPALAAHPATSDTAGTGEDISGTVTFWHAYSADSPEVDTLENTIIPAFEQLHPDVDVQSVPVPYDDLHQKLVTAVAGGELPDLVRSDIIWVPELANLGVLVPLDTDMPDFQSYADQMYPGTLATNLWDGHYYGLPLDTNTRVMMYNADTLAAAGLDAPPATFDDLTADAAKFTGGDTYLFADNGTSGWNLLPWIWSGGGDVTDEGVTTSTGYVNSPETVAAVQMLVDLHQQGAIPDLILGDAGGTPTSEGLATGIYATILDGPWMFPIFADQYPDFQLLTAPVPAGAGGSVSVVGGESVVLTQSSDNKPAATEFMRYLLSKDAQLAMAGVGQMPVVSALGDDVTSIHDYYGVFVDQLASARPRPQTPAWPQIDQVLQAQTQLAFRGDATVQEALDGAAEQIDALLAQYNG